MGRGALEGWGRSFDFLHKTRGAERGGRKKNEEWLMSPRCTTVSQWGVSDPGGGKEELAWSQPSYTRSDYRSWSFTAVTAIEEWWLFRHWLLHRVRFTKRVTNTFHTHTDTHPCTLHIWLWENVTHLLCSLHVFSICLSNSTFIIHWTQRSVNSGVQ